MQIKSNWVHGDWDLQRVGRVLVTQTAGAWNLPAMELFCQEYLQQIEPICEQPWASLLLIDQFELGVPEFEPLLKALLHNLTERNLVREAAVFSGGYLREQQMQRNLPLHKTAYQRRNFTDIEQACHWLQREGFAIQPSQIRFRTW